MKTMIKSLLFVSSMALGAWVGVVGVIVAVIAWGVWEVRRGTK